MPLKPVWKDGKKTWPKFTFGPLKYTRFHELGYQFQAGSWRFIDRETGNPVGTYYRSQSALVDDIERFAKQWGCQDAQ